MTATDWIALAQALLLAAGAWFAWRGYVLAGREHREEREEARKAPLRELVNDVIRELKEVAAQAEETVPGVGIKRPDLIAGRQRRLEIALRFAPWRHARRPKSPLTRSEMRPKSFYACSRRSRLGGIRSRT